MLSIHPIPENINRNTKKKVAFLFKNNATNYWSDIIARCFWESCGDILNKFHTKSDIAKLYHFWTYSSLYPKKLIGHTKHFSEILNLLIYDGKVCNLVDKHLIHWDYNKKKCPPKYLHWDYDLQLHLGKYIHADTKEDSLYSSHNDIVVCNARRISKYFYLEMGHLMIHINKIEDLLLLYVIWLNKHNWGIYPNHHHVLSNLQYYLQVCTLNYNNGIILWS